MVWWAVIIFCLLVLAGAITSSMLSCSSMKAWFTAGACSTPRDIKAATISLWYAYAVDMVTDLMIMFLPIKLIWNLQMPLSQKLSIGGLFALGFVCIAVATIRVKELGSTVNNSQPSATWLALWGIVESSIAVIIGCGPGLYRKAKAIYKTHTSSAGGYNSRGYARYNSRGNEGDVLGSSSRGNDIPLSKTFRTTTASFGRSPRSHDDAASSQEELAAPINLDGRGIMVTKSVTVGVQEENAESMRSWDRGGDGRPHAY
ncbi:uncharacterized protein HMPREF1541_07109 [Cyphellophora europaea CBS 101466]|uniref:Rhodopsin domain-containing protein n=1 Tax=Cyphellophora europaea (strain CBS 101466) TaxID=1220924 RepID=W2RLZ1_CYPE1|nr:uncharacterized protein HMPREF1541_07109 [Cyphellophora europaea CBS 101466]ETN37487.1 hypothetical protein HMPREF1541_07109 [Cyphellophora europaea CBS 101466]